MIEWDWKRQKKRVVGQTVLSLEVNNNSSMTRVFKWHVVHDSKN